MAIERAGFLTEFTADVSGLEKGGKQATETLHGVEDATKATNEELGKGKEKLEEHGQAAEHAGHHHALLAGHLHEAHAAMSQLNDIAGNTGITLRDLFSLQTIGITAFGLALGRVVELFGSLEEAEAEAAKKLQTGVGATMEQLETVARSAATAYGDFLKTLNNTGADEAQHRASENRIKNYKAEIAAIEAVSKAKDDAAEADIKRQSQAGLISPQEAESKVAAIRVSAKRRGIENSDRTEVEKLQEEEGELHRAQQEFDTAKGKALSSEERQHLEKQIKSAEERSSPTGERSEKANFDEKQAELNRKIEDFDEMQRRKSGVYGGDVGNGEGELGAFFKSSGSNAMDAARVLGRFFEGKGATFADDSDVAKAKEEMERAASDRDKAAKLVKDAQDERDRSEKRIKEDDENRKAMERAKRQIDEYDESEGIVAQHEEEIERNRRTNEQIFPSVPGEASPAPPSPTPPRNPELEALQGKIRQTEISVDNAGKYVKQGNHGYDSTLKTGLENLHHLLDRVVALTAQTTANSGDAAESVNQLAKMYHELERKISAIEAEQNRMNMRQNNNR